MNEKPPDPVSEFLRFLIGEWEKSGKKLYELAAAAKLAKSMPSQLKARTSDASFYSATKLAKPFGYADLPELVNAAWAWWNSDRSTKPEGTVESPQVAAMRLAIGYGVTPAQASRVLERYPPAQYAHMDELWWLSRFHEERTLEAEQDRALLATGRAAVSEAKRVAGKQAEHRDAVEKRAKQKADKPAPASQRAPKRHAS